MKIWGLCLTVLLLSVQLAVAEGLPHLPIAMSSDHWTPLYEQVDEALQKRLEKRLMKNPQWAELIKKKKMAVGLVDLSQPDSALFARVNGRTMMYAASLPKIGIMLAVFQAFEDGELEETPEIEDDLNAMIRGSSNRAAARLCNLVGFDKIRAVLTDPRYALFDESKDGGLWVGKAYAKQGVRRPDPLKGLVHGANVMQVCRFYYLLATGRLVSFERSREMLAIMTSPGIHHKFVRSLDKLAPRAQLYRKSGTWKQWHADSVLVWGDEWRRYILVALIESPRGSKIMENLVPAAEEVLAH